MFCTIAAFACSDWEINENISVLVRHGPGTEYYVQETQRWKPSDCDISWRKWNGA